MTPYYDTVGTALVKMVAQSPFPRRSPPISVTVESHVIVNKWG